MLTDPARRQGDVSRPTVLLRVERLRERERETVGGGVSYPLGFVIGFLGIIVASPPSLGDCHRSSLPLWRTRDTLWSRCDSPIVAYTEQYSVLYI